MSTIKLNIQRFGAGGGADWSSGITKSAVQTALDNFNQVIQEAEDAIMNYASVDSALQAGWSGVDCQNYLEKFHTHAQDVKDKIENYRQAVSKEAQSIIEQWETFQQNLIG